VYVVRNIKIVMVFGNTNAMLSINIKKPKVNFYFGEKLDYS
jgi:hypothetical protein